MKNRQARKIICMIKLIIKDSIKLLGDCLIATILVSVCMENGWILSKYTTEVSNDMFWKLFSAIFVLVPIVMFYRGIMGKYKVKIEMYKVDVLTGDAKQIPEEDSNESNKCNNNR